MLATDRWLLAAGLLANGYSVNETDPAKIDEAKDLLIAAKKTLLAYDDTTFYSKLVSGEALLVQAWDGWCNYGITDNPDDQVRRSPRKARDLWVDTMVVHEGIREQGRGVQVHQLHARRQEPRLGGAEHPLQGAEQGGDGKPRSGDSCKTYPNMAMAAGRPGQVRAAARRRRGAAGLFARVVSEIMAAQ